MLSKQPRTAKFDFKMKVEISSALLFASGLPLASAWGTLGHETVAYIATNFGELTDLKRVQVAKCSFQFQVQPQPSSRISLEIQPRIILQMLLHG